MIPLRNPLLPVLLTVVVLAVGCKTDAEPDRITTNHPVGTPELTLNKADIGKQCTQDRDCALYLRCFDATCQVPPAVEGTGDPATSPAVSIVTKEGEAQFFVEVVDSRPERSRGLMYRKKMHDSWGMLFLYPPPDHQQSFWMKNTYIPLDMLFITGDMKVLGVVENAEPKTLVSRKVKGNSRFVLELNAGIAKRYGIQAGDRVHFGRISDEVLRKAESQ